MEEFTIYRLLTWAYEATQANPRMTRGSHLKDTDRGDWQQIKLRHVAKKKKKREEREKYTNTYI